MTVLDRESQVTKPAALAELAPKAEPGPEERELAKKLIEASSTDLNFAQYRDVYKERLTALIETKVAGKEIVAAPPQEEPHVINLMEALRQSIAQSQKAEGQKEEQVEKPARKMAESKRDHGRERKRKSS
jgi:DNA end-binding protein Ku